MNDDFSKIIKAYRDSKIKSLMMFNWTVSFVTVVVGIISLLKDFVNTKVFVITFSENRGFDILFSLLFISLGVLTIVYINKTQTYRKVLFLLTAVWVWIYLNQLILGLSQTPNVKHILIIPIIVQLIYMMKASVFLYETD
ncbi:hypothetical protein AM2_158 [Lactococcus phage AM2]|uniref:Uncharacterized protein n=9 Tax=Audreyjarvisvirus TaxID=2843351 RepID=A0A1W6JLU7_9CAUD|nr:hypothetical protein H1Z30_gp113 [Lactococcus phage AM1]YP_009905449.1 hypothetical protein H1Z35_gp127 [Lactococcus phage AM4]ARM66463.1 hypothetical protein AM2_158 [Lactococcus phage AM2]ARM66640.1 hypothetical protein AM3_158 [Lactococcus phage AM3]ARM67016.1 hypothetical protein AM5_163 [Lactococcus phage AM5]ARM67194.1 hypothetical protein AM8_159 [Lactococcus phage AM8]ARM67373.1 hypothetical protein AM9_160 [Lactococcus phage AM9]ARM67551.1 hypothetical protein AM11_159 [Lactococc